MGRRSVPVCPSTGGDSRCCRGRASYGGKPLGAWFPFFHFRINQLVGWMAAGNAACARGRLRSRVSVLPTQNSLHPLAGVGACHCPEGARHARRTARRCARDARVSACAHVCLRRRGHPRNTVPAPPCETSLGKSDAARGLAQRSGLGRLALLEELTSRLPAVGQQETLGIGHLERSGRAQSCSRLLGPAINLLGEFRRNQTQTHTFLLKSKTEGGFGGHAKVGQILGSGGLNWVEIGINGKFGTLTASTHNLRDNIYRPVNAAVSLVQGQLPRCAPPRAALSIWGQGSYKDCRLGGAWT